MSVWTHVAGVIRIDDYSLMIMNKKTDFSKIFIRNTWTYPNKEGNLPEGSEGSLDVEFIDRMEPDSSSYIRTVCFFGDLRDVGAEDCNKIQKWWEDIPELLGEKYSIRQAVLEIKPENGVMSVLTEKDMIHLELNK